MSLDQLNLPHTGHIPYAHAAACPDHPAPAPAVMMDPTVHLDGSPVGPPHNSSLLIPERRRRSVPINAAPGARRQSSNYVNLKPASSEVITSLISTFSAISPPLHHQHSDHRPDTCSHSSPSSPLPLSAEFAYITSSTRDAEEIDAARIRFSMDSDFGETTAKRKETVRLSPHLL